MTQTIFKCEQFGIGKCDGKGWHVQTTHLTGNPWSEENCPKFRTKAEAAAAVRDFEAMAAAYAEEQTAQYS